MSEHYNQMIELITQMFKSQREVTARNSDHIEKLFQINSNLIKRIEELESTVKYFEGEN